MKKTDFGMYWHFQVDGELFQYDRVFDHHRFATLPALPFYVPTNVYNHLASSFAAGTPCTSRWVVSRDPWFAIGLFFFSEPRLCAALAVAPNHALFAGIIDLPDIALSPSFGPLDGSRPWIHAPHVEREPMNGASALALSEQGTYLDPSLDCSLAMLAIHDECEKNNTRHAVARVLADTPAFKRFLVNGRP